MVKNDGKADDPRERRAYERDRRVYEIPDEDFERLARRAAELALREVYVDIGKGFVSKVLWVLGLAGIAIWAWIELKVK